MKSWSRKEQQHQHHIKELEEQQNRQHRPLQNHIEEQEELPLEEEDNLQPPVQ